MPYVDVDRAVIYWKVVYYGPGLSGKTTNLQHLSKIVKQKQLFSIAGEGSRTVYFDYMPIEFPAIDGFKPIFKLYTVPGQVKYSKTRAMLLKGVDGIIFVVDPQKQIFQNNVESLNELRQNLHILDIDMDDLDIIFQYNKQDLDNIIPSDEAGRALEADTFPSMGAIASTGENVKKTLELLGNQMVKRFYDNPEKELLKGILSMEIKSFLDFFKDQDRLRNLKWLVENIDNIKKNADTYTSLIMRLEKAEKTIITVNKVIDSFNQVLKRFEQQMEDFTQRRGFFSMFRRKKP